MCGVCVCCIFCISMWVDSAGCIFLHLPCVSYGWSCTKANFAFLFKLFPNTLISLEQIHVFKISLRAKLTVSLFIQFPKAIMVFFLFFAWLIPSLLQGLFFIVHLITYIAFIFFEHSYASLSLLFYYLFETSYQFTPLVIRSLSLARD